ncbi:hypothetical protein, partial [Nitrosomonas sp.]|uniref:hypothetical protein n=1 Tax=Nitrosomonas sp. TaxID=42353 RepID=UPI0033066252
MRLTPCLIPDQIECNGKQEGARAFNTRNILPAPSLTFTEIARQMDISSKSVARYTSSMNSIPICRS